MRHASLEVAITYLQKGTRSEKMYFDTVLLAKIYNASGAAAAIVIITIGT